VENLLTKLKEGFKSHSVLIIDDDVELAESLSRILRTFFHECVIAKDGVKGIELYTQRLEANRPFAVVITDLELSKKGGLALIKEIRTLNALQPILLLSAYDEAEFMTAAIALQVQGYLLKPLSMPKLLDSLETILELTTHKPAQIDADYDRITGWRSLSALESIVNGAAFGGAILMRIRIDHLNNMFDLVGREYTDEYIRELCAVLESLVEEKNRNFFRSSQNEFFLLINDESIEYIQSLAADMASVTRYFYTSERGIILNSTLSIGIAQGSDNLLIQSIIALSSAHESHGGKIGIYNQSSLQYPENALRGREILQMIFSALEEENIFPLFQPIVNSKTKTIEMYQSLIRIRKDGKVYGPETFLQIAITAHQMSMITRAVIRNSFLAFSKLDHNNAILLINLSSEDLNDEGLIAYILFWIQRYNLEAASICFEIGDGNRVIVNQYSLSLIRELKTHGCKILLNDFASVKTGLSVFLTISPDYVKIDNDVLIKLMNDPNRMKMFGKMIEMLHLGGAKVIAKHLSDPLQIQPLEAIGIDFLQGFAIEKPFEVM
jgi:EAL domain-containing protein (putative c-di-GMP-specific phosphodiesterase class I)/DNA-binding NarL/FixJ family response regulator